MNKGKYEPSGLIFFQKKGGGGVNEHISNKEIRAG